MAGSLRRRTQLRGHSVRINLSGGPVPGVGGLSLIALGTLVALVSPQLWWVAVAVVLAGCLLGFGFVLAHRREGLHSRKH